MRSLLILSLFGISHAWKPGNTAALKTAVDACLDRNSNPPTKDGSECYACADGTHKTSSTASCDDGSTPQFISEWDVSNLKSLKDVFEYTAFNQDISSWDTSSVTDITGLFDHNSEFNQDISAWDTAKVKEMGGTFKEATSFNQDLSCWDVSSVTWFHSTFKNSAMDRKLCWVVSGTSTTTNMFSGTTGSVDATCTAACAAEGGLLHRLGVHIWELRRDVSATSTPHSRKRVHLGRRLQREMHQQRVHASMEAC